jgi:hypothetical protein
MELKFSHALFAAGAFLVLTGAVAFITGLASPSEDPGALEAFSRSVDTIFLALFSGVLMGVGIALLGNYLLLAVFGKKKHILIPSLFSILFLTLSILAVFGRDSSPLFALVALFACIAASGAFLITALFCALSKTVCNYIATLR